MGNTYIGLTGVIPGTDQWPVVAKGLPIEKFEEFKFLCQKLKKYEYAENKFDILNFNKQFIERHLDTITSPRNHSTTEEEHQADHLRLPGPAQGRRAPALPGVLG